MFSLPVSYFPSLLKVLPLFPPAMDRMFDISKGIMKSRESQGVQGQDILSKLVELVKEIKKDPNNENYEGLNESIVTAQGVIFFTAGFETTSATFTFLRTLWPNTLRFKRLCIKRLLMLWIALKGELIMKQLVK